MRLSIEDIKVNVSNAMKWKNGVLQIDILKVHVPVCVHEKKRKIKKKKGRNISSPNFIHHGYFVCNESLPCFC